MFCRNTCICIRIENDLFLFQVYDLDYKKCIHISASLSNYTRIEPNNINGALVDIKSITIHMPKCKENYIQTQLINPRINEYESKKGSNPEFHTWLKPNVVTGEEYLALIDVRGRRDLAKAQYENFCMDRYFSRSDEFKVVGHQVEW